MRRLLTIAIYCLVQAAAAAQIAVSFPPARPISQFPDTATVVVMGDVMMHMDQITNAARPDGSYDFSTYFSNIQHIIESADLAVANMEFTLAGKPYTGYPCFSAPDGYEDYVASAGVDVFLTANNHILDKGRGGLKRTLERYSRMREAGLVWHTGSALSPEDHRATFPLILAVKGTRIALVNFTYGTNVSVADGYPKVNLTDRKEIEAAVRKARRTGADFVIALPHWGVEYSLRHSAAQEALADWLVEIGCDAVVGAHPHVPQDHGEIASVVDGGVRKVPVVYSLGNLVSNMSAANTQVGIIARLRFVTSEDGSKELLRPELILTWCSRPGSLTDSYSVLPVESFVGKRDLWKRPSDYDNMIRSVERVKKATGIENQ
ncbi:MAG: CapA family protein [Bacteroidales bacterium]|nr:CapA family protein [Bacteroidales bacterium]